MFLINFVWSHRIELGTCNYGFEWRVLALDKLNFMFVNVNYLFLKLKINCI